MPPQEFAVPYFIANGFALAALALAWWKRDAARWVVVAVFVWAACTNARIALVRPEAYLEYAALTPSALYRAFILGWFASHIQSTVLPIAAGQATIAGLLATRRPALRRLGAAGAWIFLGAIAPLGVGSGFPFSITFGAAVWLALRSRPVR